MRRALRYTPPVLLLLAVLELAVFVLVGRGVGFTVALLLLVGASLLGLVLLRREGIRAWRGLRAATRSGQPPGRQVTDASVGLVGALLLALPGLVSGAVGLLVLVPPLRRLVRVGVQRGAERRVSSMAAGDLFGPRVVRVRQGHAQPPAAEPGPAVEGEIIGPGRG